MMIINYTGGENYLPFTGSARRGALMEARKSNLKSPFPTIAMIYRHENMILPLQEE